MKCKECKKREAVIKTAVVSIRYEKTAIEVVCDQVCMKCFKKSLSRIIVVIKLEGKHGKKK